MSGLDYYRSPIGELRIESAGDKITSVTFLKSEKALPQPTPVTAQCIAELDEYFFEGRKFFNVELDPGGTPFQQKVWSMLITIPFGKTISYEAIAVALGDINTIRAVGLANGQNPIMIMIPCHRVIGKNGNLVGYAGGIENKSWLLQHEGAFSEQLKLF